MSHKFSICVLRISSLGDIVLTSVLLRNLRNRFPDANIVIAVAKKYADIVRFNRHCSRVVTIDTSNGIKELLLKRQELLQINDGNKYDIVLDLQKNLRTRILKTSLGKTYREVDKFRRQKIDIVHRKKGIGEPIIHIVERYRKTAEEWGILNDSEGLELWLESEKNSHFYPPTKRENPQTLRIGIAPGARHFTKRYPIEKYCKLITLLHEKYPHAEFDLFGGEEEKELCKDIADRLSFEVNNKAGYLNLLDSVVEIDKCVILISNDSGLMHVAAARRVPVIAIFGSTVKEFGFAPYGTKSNIVEVDLPCRPCSHIGRDNCPLGHFDCMNKIEPSNIVAAIDELM